MGTPENTGTPGTQNQIPGTEDVKIPELTEMAIRAKKLKAKVATVEEEYASARAKVRELLHKNKLEIYRDAEANVKVWLSNAERLYIDDHSDNKQQAAA